MLRVCFVIGTRPEIIRLSATLKRFRRLFDVKLIHTGQNFSPVLGENIFQDLGIEGADIHLNCGSGETVAERIGLIISRSYDVFTDMRPDVVVILGDTDSSLAAIAAKRLKIPIFHLEGGNRCWNLNTPEEINRKIVDHLSDIHVVYSHNSKENLLSEGIPRKRIMVAGTPLREVIKDYSDKIDKSSALGRLGLKKDVFLLASVHRSEHVDEKSSLMRSLGFLRDISLRLGKEIILSCHPRLRLAIESQNLAVDGSVRLIDPLPFTDYIALQKAAYCVLSDSGSVAEEAALLGINAVWLREWQERDEAVEAGVLSFVGFDVDLCLSAIESLKTRSCQKIRSPLEYEYDNFSEKMVNYVISYTEYINREVWQK